MDEATQYPRFRWWVLVSASLGIAGMQINMIGLAPLLPEVAGELNVSMGAAANLMAVFLLTSAFALVIGGVICDRFGLMWAVIPGLLCSALPAVLMPLVGSSYGAVFAARFVQGISAGFLICIMAPVVAMWFPIKEKGLASGIMGASMSLGSAVGVVAAPAVFLATGAWKNTVALLSMASWAALAVNVLVARGTHSRETSSADAPGQSQGGVSFRNAVFSRFSWLGILVTICIAWVLQCLYNLIPGYFAADVPVGAGFGPMMSGQLMLVVMVAGTIGPVMAGLLQDKAFGGNSTPVILMGFVACAVSIYLLQLQSVYGSLLFLVPCLAVAGACVQFVYPPLVVLVSRSYPLQIVGKMVGVWLGIGTLGAAIGLSLCGQTVDWFGDHKIAISLIALIAVVGFVFAVFLGRAKRPDSA